jgi:hypothetical protein
VEEGGVVGCESGVVPAEEGAGGVRGPQAQPEQAFGCRHELGQQRGELAQHLLRLSTLATHRSRRSSQCTLHDTTCAQPQPHTPHDTTRHDTHTRTRTRMGSSTRIMRVRREATSWSKRSSTMWCTSR